MRKKTRIDSSEEDDLTLSKTPPKHKKFKIMDHEISDGLSEDYYSSPKRSLRNYNSERSFERDRRRSSRLTLNQSPKKLKYALRSSNPTTDQSVENTDYKKNSLNEDQTKYPLHQGDNYTLENVISDLQKEEFSEDFERFSGNGNYPKITSEKRSTKQIQKSENYEENYDEHDTGHAHDNEYNDLKNVHGHLQQESEDSIQESENESDEGDDEVWEEEEEEEEDDFYDLTDDMRMTRSRKAYYRSDKNNDSRSLRKKQPVNYANQMYPQVFKDVDALVELDKSNNLPLGFNQKNTLNINRNWGLNMRSPSKLFRLNEVFFNKINF